MDKTLKTPTSSSPATPMLVTSPQLPAQLTPIVKTIIVGLILIAGIVGYAVLRQQFPEVFVDHKQSSIQNQIQNKNDGTMVQSPTESFVIEHPSGLYKSYQSNLLRFFPNEAAANNYASCLESGPNLNPGDCQLVMSVAIEQYPQDYAYSLERVRDSGEPNLPAMSSFTDDKGRVWLKTAASSSSSGYTLTAETKTETGIYLLSIEASQKPYQSQFGKDLTPESLSELINDMLTTVEFTNQ